MTTPTTFDQPWKRVLDRCFRDFMQLALPKAARAIDWDKGYETLDKELADLTEGGDTGDRVADLLVKVHPRGGNEAWVLVHLEVQMQPDPMLPQRMYTYSYRAFDRYAKRVAGIAILGDRRRSHRPDTFSYELFGTEQRLRYPVVKILDFEARRAELSKSRNPFSRVLLAHLEALRTSGDPDARLPAKIALVRDLIEQGYDRKSVTEIFRFLDLVMTMPKPLEDEFDAAVQLTSQQKELPWLSNIERKAMRAGREEGREEGRQEGSRLGLERAIVAVLCGRFGAVPPQLRDALHAIGDDGRLEDLVREAVVTPSLDGFAAKLANS